MKPQPRHWLALALLLSLLASWGVAAQELVPIPALDSPVVDTTGTLDDETRQQLEAQALALQQRKGSQLQVLVVPSTQPEDIAQYAQRVFDAWQLGRKDVDDGVLLLVAKDDRRVRIQVGYGLEGAIPDADAERVIQEYLLPEFRNDDYADGIVDGSAVLVRLIDGEPLPEPAPWFPLGMKIVVGLFLLPFIAMPIVAIVAAWRQGPLAFFGRWAVVLVVVAAYAIWTRGTLQPGSEAWIPLALIGYLTTVFTFFGALGTAGGRAGSSSSSSGSSSSSSSSSSSWSGGGGRSGGGGASGGW